MKFAFLAALILVLTSTTTSSIVDCGAGTSLFQITELGLTPDPPIIGKDVYLTLKFNNPYSEIDDGTATSKVSINGIPYPPSSDPLCEKTACPLKVGANDRSTSSLWPELSGKIDTTIQWTDVNGGMLLCIHSIVKVASTEQYLRGNKTISS